MFKQYNQIENDLTENDNNILKKYFFKYRRLYYVKFKSIGLEGKYQLSFDVENTKLFYTHNNYYSGKVLIYFGNRYLNTSLNSIENFKTILNYFKQDFIIFFKKNPHVLNKYRSLFFNFDILYSFSDIVFSSLKSDNVLANKKQPIKKFIYLQKREEDKNILNVIPFICSHIETFKNILDDKINFLERINKFINDEVIYDNGLAICKICSENILDLNIKGALFFNNHYITYYNDLLFYPPYNKFTNIKYFFDNIFYLYNQHTKLIIIDSNLLIRLFVDNLIQISSERLILENKYKHDIESNNIFFLRLSNNFFDINDEKEKFQEKKTVFIYIPLFFVILTMAPISDFYEFLFLRHIISIDKIYKQNNNTLITLEDVMVAIILFFFKKVLITYYDEYNIKEKTKRIYRTIEIYKEIFSDDFMEIFEVKKKTFDELIQKKISNNKKLEILPYYNGQKKNLNGSDFDQDNQYGLTTKIVKKFLFNKHISDFYKDRVIKYNIVSDIIESDEGLDNNLNVKTIEITKTLLKNTQISKIDLPSILLEEFKSKKEYSIGGKIYKLTSLDNKYLFYNSNNNLLFDHLENSIVKTLNNSLLFNFYTYNDNNLYKQLTEKIFNDNLYYFIIMLETLLNISISFDYSAINIYNREEYFIIRIKIVEILENLLEINNIEKIFSQKSINNDI